MSRIRTALCLVSSCGFLSTVACSSNDTAAPAGPVGNDASTLDSAPGADAAAPSNADATGSADGEADDSQTPPMGHAALEAWLATGVYKSWTKEAAIHMQRPPSPHGYDRIYSNAIIAANATGTSAWPVGAAAVKELYTATTDTAPVGYAVYLKTQADSAGGANWYWYERVPPTSSVPHDSNGVVADGLAISDAGTPFTICVNCHGAAGSDANHTPSVGGRDQVYTPLPQP